MTKALWILLGQPKLVPLPATFFALKDTFFGMIKMPIRILEQCCDVMLYVFKDNRPVLSELVISPKNFPEDVVLTPFGTTKRNLIEMSILRQMRARARMTQFPQEPQTSTSEQRMSQPN